MIFKYYILQHSRFYSDKYHEEVRTLWIFSSKRKAIEAKNILKDKPWFKDYPKGFCISKCFLNNTFWEDGFEN